MYKKNSFSNNADGHPSKRLCLDKNANLSTSTYSHNASAYDDDDDDIWDDIDPSVIEDCILKATQALKEKSTSTTSKSTSVQKDPSKVGETKHSTVSASSSKPTNDFLKNKFSDFSGSTSRSSSLTNSSGAGAEMSSRLTEELSNLKREKKSLEDELLLKKGEASNLRNELKRRESLIEAEKVERCAAVESAEKRGKEKMKKEMAQLETRISSLQKQLEKSQGEVIFKNREVEELVSKCRQLEQKRSPSQKFPLGSQQAGAAPASKRLTNGPLLPKVSPAKGAAKLSPGKSPLNFNERFDFSGNKPKPKLQLVDAESQTELKSTKLQRCRIKTQTKRGKVSYSRKLSLALASSPKPWGESGAATCPEGICIPPLYSSLLCLRMPEYSLLERASSLSRDSIDCVVNEACTKLKEIRESFGPRKPSSIHNKGTPRPRDGTHSRQWYALSCLPHVKAIGIGPCHGEPWLKAVGELTSHLEQIAHEGENVNVDMVEPCLEALAILGKETNQLPKESCNDLLSALKASLVTFPPEEKRILWVCNALVSFSSFENFRMQLCFEAGGDCFLKTFCRFISENTSAVSDLPRLCQQLVRWTSKLITRPPFWVSKGRCGCCPQLLSTLVKLLDEILHPDASDEILLVVISGVRLLHRWQLADPSFSEKIASLPHYVTFMSAFVRSSEAWKGRGILDKASGELSQDLYEVEELHSS